MYYLERNWRAWAAIRFSTSDLTGLRADLKQLKLRRFGPSPLRYCQLTAFGTRDRRVCLQSSNVLLSDHHAINLLPESADFFVLIIFVQGYKYSLFNWISLYTFLM